MGENTYCPGCGNILSDSQDTCPFCGIRVNTQKMGFPPQNSSLVYGIPVAAYPPPHPVKKKRVGLVIGIVVGSFFGLVLIVLLGLFILGTVIQHSDLTSDTNPTESTEPAAGTSVSENPEVKPGYYYNDPIGFSLKLDSDWAIRDNEKDPDRSMLFGYRPRNGVVITQILVNRYPGYDREYFIGDNNNIFANYLHAFDSIISSNIFQEEVVINNRTWTHAMAFMTSSDQRYYVELYITDMPNDRGVFTYAIIVNASKPGPPELPGVDSAKEMLVSLYFIK